MRRMLFIRAIAGEKIGGIEGKILSIADELFTRQLFEPMLATDDPESNFAKQFRCRGFRVFAIPFRGRRALYEAASRLCEIADTENICLFQSHKFRESIACRRARSRRPGLKHVFRVHTHIQGCEIPVWRKLLYHVLDWHTRSGVDHFVPISGAIHDELLRFSRIRACKVSIVHNGIPAPGDPEVPSAMDQPVPAEVAVIGDLQPRKQQHVAAAALGELAKRGIRARLHLIGRDREGYARVIRDTAAANGVADAVRFHGYVPPDKVYGLVRTIPIIALPSQFEGVPTSIIEGMALRKVVVTTPVGGTTELVKDGVNGFLHNPTDVRALADILEKIMTTPSQSWEAMRDAAYRTWREGFSVDIMMDGLMRVYRMLKVA